MADRLTVTVTEDDINEGLIDECTLCPIALAISRETGVSNVWVGPGAVVYMGWVEDEPIGYADYFPTDERASEFIEWFDCEYDEREEFYTPYAEPFPLTLEFVAAGGAA